MAVEVGMSSEESLSDTHDAKEVIEGKTKAITT
jgi:hypothetical protein